MMTLGVGVGAGFVTGDRRNADGEGIVIVAIEFEQAYEPATGVTVVMNWLSGRKKNRYRVWCWLCAERRGAGPWRDLLGSRASE